MTLEPAVVPRINIPLISFPQDNLPIPHDPPHNPRGDAGRT